MAREAFARAMLRVRRVCACEPPETWLAAFRRNMDHNGTDSVTVAQVNRFWAFRLRCGQRRCRSHDLLPAALVARYLPVANPNSSEDPVPA